MSNRYLLNNFFFILIFILTGCGSAFNEKKVLFVGDSLIAGWDIESYFPYLNFTNKGVYGEKVNDISVVVSGVDSLNTTLVVLVGTNDISMNKANILNPIFFDNLVSQYKQIIMHSRSNHTVVISVLPRRDAGSELMNKGIMEFNQRLSKMVKEIPGTIFFDVYSKFTDRNGLLDNNYSADGVHINSYGYELLSSELSRFL